jgi:hypothetical protein
MMSHPFLQKAQKRMGHGEFVLVRKPDAILSFRLSRARVTRFDSAGL